MKKVLSRSGRRVVVINASGSESRSASGFSPLLAVPEIFRSGVRSQDNFTDLDLSVPFPVADRRLFNPENPISRPAKRFSGIPARVISPKLKKARYGRSRPFLSSFPSVLAFQRPRSVALCVRRSVRRQVLFSRGVPGRRVAKPGRNAFSNVRC
ncbi:hypothetical protein [Apis mellifera associated microvirus 46]|nr:hypothetical protein [Apis mellifera associated microvirus 46]